MITDKTQIKQNQEFKHLYRLTIVTLIVWTIIIVSNLGWDIRQESLKTLELAAIEARSNFNKDKALRLWSALHGGVYVPISERTPPNPNMAHIPERDITTPSGKKLTLMNPAYMMRQVMDEYFGLYGVKGKITSDKLLNINNAPDTWEQMALQTFSRGEKERIEVNQINNIPHLRLMQPLHAKENCLKCHEHQGYMAGDLRGGVSVSIDLTPYLETRRQTVSNLIFSHTLIWALMTAAVLIVSRRSRNHLMKRLQLQTNLATNREQLKTERQQLQEIIWGTNAGTWEWNIQTGETKLNERWAEIVGYTLEELEPIDLTTWLNLTHDEDLNISEKLLKKTFSHQLDYYECEARMRHKNGHWVWVLNRGKVVEWNNDLTPLRMSGTSADITARKHAEESLRENEKRISASLAEKEVLLREIHHRVKNNLQITSSLLQLQARKENPDIAVALYESERRVKVMAQVHEKLCLSKDLQHVDTHEFLWELIEDLKSSQTNTQAPITIHQEIERIGLNLDQSILVGQIFSELLSNAIKHAFPDRQSGTIDISMHKTSSGEIELSLSDNGIGLPEGFDYTKVQSLGWQLISTLSAKLGATIELERSNGTCIRLLFSEDKE